MHLALEQPSVEFDVDRLHQMIDPIKPHTARYGPVPEGDFYMRYFHWEDCTDSHKVNLSVPLGGRRRGLRRLGTDRCTDNRCVKRSSRYHVPSCPILQLRPRALNPQCLFGDRGRVSAFFLSCLRRSRLQVSTLLPSMRSHWCRC